MKLCAKLAERLDILDMKQTELSAKTGIPPTTLNGYIKGRREPDLDTIAKLAVALETTVVYLIDGDMSELKKNTPKQGRNGNWSEKKRKAIELVENGTDEDAAFIAELYERYIKGGEK